MRRRTISRAGRSTSTVQCGEERAHEIGAFLACRGDCRRPHEPGIAQQRSRGIVPWTLGRLRDDWQRLHGRLGVPHQHVVGQPADGCSSPFTGTPVYQTQWVNITADGLNWREIGTGHQCNDTYRYWYWGYGSNGTWHWIGYQTGISNGQWHTFKIDRVFDDTFERYKFRIDGVIKGTLNSNATGEEVLAGLESYAVNATVAGHNYTTLQYQKLDGAFLNWAGKDKSVVNAPLCGSWVAAVSWRAGEGAGQC